MTCKEVGGSVHDGVRKRERLETRTLREKGSIDELSSSVYSGRVTPEGTGGINFKVTDTGCRDWGGDESKKRYRD